MAGKYWTDTYNPLRGTDGRPHCTKVSPGCLNCWASGMNHRFGGGDYNSKDEDFEFMIKKDIIVKPIKTRKPQIYFVCNNMDIFHKSIPFDLIWDIILVPLLVKAQKHKFLFLTKRTKRMLEFFEWCNSHSDYFLKIITNNVWFGASVESDEYTWRIDDLMTFPGNKWLSVEPMLGSVDLSKWIDKIDWVTAGCETGPKRRSVKERHFRDLQLACQKARVPFWLKQMDFDGTIVHPVSGCCNELPEGFAEILYG